MATCEPIDASVLHIKRGRDGASGVAQSNERGDRLSSCSVRSGEARGALMVAFVISHTSMPMERWKSTYGQFRAHEQHAGPRKVNRSQRDSESKGNRGTERGEGKGKEVGHGGRGRGQKGGGEPARSACSPSSPG